MYPGLVFSSHVVIHIFIELDGYIVALKAFRGQLH